MTIIEATVKLRAIMSDGEVFNDPERARLVADIIVMVGELDKAIERERAHFLKRSDVEAKFIAAVAALEGGR